MSGPATGRGEGVTQRGGMNATRSGWADEGAYRPERRRAATVADSTALMRATVANSPKRRPSRRRRSPSAGFPRLDESRLKSSALRTRHPAPLGQRGNRSASVESRRS